MSDAPHKPPKLTPSPEVSQPPQPEPPRREFQVKPTEFERVNRPADATPGNAPIDVRQIYRQANRPPPVTKAPPPAVPPPDPVPVENDVPAMLRANLAKANAQGLNKVALHPARVSRRKRDYWTIIIGGNLLALLSLTVLHRNVITLAFTFGGMIFCSIAVTWVMWMVLDDY